MKIARFSTSGSIRFGILDGDDLVVLGGDPMFQGLDTTGERVPLAQATLLAPSIPRSKVVGVGRNYVDHVQEMGGDTPPSEPLLFLKPNTSVVGPGDTIVLPRQSSQVDFEGELAIVIGSIAKNVTADRAHEVIFGYTVANDVTARDLQRSDDQWTRAKGFDTFCPIGPFVETDFDVASGTITTTVNGEVKQSGPLTDMVHGVEDIVAYASSVFTLLPGDLILTGTPAGVGPIRAGDVVEVTISGIGSLSNPVAAPRS
ncbi:fumarylacetoacetate hydrolase family protein [Labedella endophytica]|uniref:FAA hydrolase family protein n=1 Tax=Labedella endophytica TaxID=1523160 RepID=A0A433JNG5_9MICO|nr:fumarylacetoacetate hydrolase family protein [Labedella endophytica]RUQ97623.1 FAA hydrolase family protein [Labedella endophytica]